VVSFIRRRQYHNLDVHVKVSVVRPSPDA